MGCSNSNTIIEKDLHSIKIVNNSDDREFIKLLLMCIWAPWNHFELSYNMLHITHVHHKHRSNIYNILEKYEITDFVDRITNFVTYKEIINSMRNSDSKKLMDSYIRISAEIEHNLLNSLYTSSYDIVARLCERIAYVSRRAIWKYCVQIENDIKSALFDVNIDINGDWYMRVAIIHIILKSVSRFSYIELRIYLLWIVYRMVLISRLYLDINTYMKLLEIFCAEIQTNHLNSLFALVPDVKDIDIFTNKLLPYDLCLIIESYNPAHITSCANIYQFIKLNI